jgi:hypothetical protein
MPLRFDEHPTPPRPLGKPEYYPYSYNGHTKYANWSTDDYEGHIKRLYTQCDAMLEYIKRLEDKITDLTYSVKNNT